MDSQNPKTKTLPDSFQKDLVRKIRIQRGVHDFLEDKTKFLLNTQKLINVTLSALITLVIFSDFGLLTEIFPSFSGKPAMLLTGCMSLIIFIVNLTADVFSLSENNAKHLQTIQQLTDLLSDIKKSKYSNEDQSIKNDRLQEFYERYLQISNSAINPGGKAFDRAQARYLQRRAIKIAIQQNPFSKRKDLLANATSLASQCSESEGEI